LLSATGHLQVVAEGPWLWQLAAAVARAAPAAEEKKEEKKEVSYPAQLCPLSPLPAYACTPPLGQRKERLLEACACCVRTRSVLGTLSARRGGDGRACMPPTTVAALGSDVGAAAEHVSNRCSMPWTDLCF